MTGERGTLEVDGARIYYEVDGQGPAVAMIHAGVANLRMWDGQVAALQDAFRVIRYDTRGYGQTVTDAVEFSNRADLAALLDHLGEESAHVVGLSRGGVIALDFAIERPERVRTLAVAAGGISGYESPVEDSPGLWESVEAIYDAKDWEGLADFETAYWADGPGQSPDRVPEVRALVHDWVLSNYRAELEEGSPQPLDPPAAGRLNELQAPLLVMAGTLDEPGATHAMRHLAAVVPGARFEEFPTAHLINLEQPGRFNALLREHFTMLS